VDIPVRIFPIEDGQLIGDYVAPYEPIIHDLSRRQQSGANYSKQQIPVVTSFRGPKIMHRRNDT
jgi:hypothetical protein